MLVPPRLSSIPTFDEGATRPLPSQINNLFDDCRTGIPLLRIEDHLQPGCVDWKKVNMKPKNIHEVSSPRREPGPSARLRLSSALAPAAIFSCLMGLALGACGTPAKIGDLADKMCACKDMACADAVVEDYKKFVEANPEFKGNTKQETKVNEEMKRYLKCRVAIKNPEKADQPLPQ